MPVVRPLKPEVEALAIPGRDDPLFGLRRPRGADDVMTAVGAGGHRRQGCRAGSGRLPGGVLRARQAVGSVADDEVGPGRFTPGAQLLGGFLVTPDDSQSIEVGRRAHRALDFSRALTRLSSADSSSAMPFETALSSETLARTSAADSRFRGATFTRE